MERLDTPVGEARPFSCSDLPEDTHAVLRVLGSRQSRLGVSQYGLPEVARTTGLAHEVVRDALADLEDFRIVLARDGRYWVVLPCQCCKPPENKNDSRFATIATTKLGSTSAYGTLSNRGSATGRAPRRMPESGSRGDLPKRPKNSYSVALYFRNRAWAAGISPGNTNIQALAGRMSSWRKEAGWKVDFIEATVDTFFDLHPDWVADRRPAWKLYIANIKRLGMETEARTRPSVVVEKYGPVKDWARQQFAELGITMSGVAGAR